MAQEDADHGEKRPTATTAAVLDAKQRQELAARLARLAWFDLADGATRRDIAAEGSGDVPPEPE